MAKIVGTRKLSGAAYFRWCLEEMGYTYKSFSETFENVYGVALSESTIASFASGRRWFRRASYQLVMRIAHLIDDPDSSERDYERYAGIAYRLANGAEFPVFE